MCEICSDPQEVWQEPIEHEPQDAQEYVCEYSTEEEPDECGEPARYEVRDRYVEAHLCERHASELAGQLKAGLMDLYQDIGLSEGEAFRPIATGTETCDWIEPNLAALEPSSGCGQPARYAKITLAAMFFCDRHKTLE